ncbi:MAG: tetratricopeptide repeat protein [Anaerolineae bacterium]|jgi:tetratricopeptide (TPR) repeat protein|nr:tetratricopeptide repeat protein [Anaerolineae bacterium]
MRQLLLVLMLFTVAGGVVGQAPTPTPPPDPCPKPSINDPDPAYFIGLGDVAFASRNYTTAIERYTCAIALKPDFAPLFVSRGFAYAQLLDYDGAMADYDTAIALDEVLPLAYINRGTLYTRLGVFGLAIGDFTLASGLNPSDPLPYVNRAVVHAMEGNLDLALSDLEAAIAIDPDFAPTYPALGAVYSALAAQSYQRFTELEGDSAPLPAGTPAEVMVAVDDSLRNGDTNIWLTLLTPAQR